MLPDRVSNPGPLTYESGALPIALRGPALTTYTKLHRGIKPKKNVEGVTVHYQSLVILLFVPSFVKLFQTVSK